MFSGACWSMEVSFVDSIQFSIAVLGEIDNNEENLHVDIIFTQLMLQEMRLDWTEDSHEFPQIGSWYLKYPSESRRRSDLIFTSCLYSKMTCHLMNSGFFKTPVCERTGKM